MLGVHETFSDKWLYKIMIKLGGYETAISKIILSQLLYNDEKMLTIKSNVVFFKENRVTILWKIIQPLIMENHKEY